MASYSPVFSQPFVLYTSGTPNTEFEVPENYTAVVREVDLYSGVGGDKLLVYVNAGGGGPAVTFCSIEAIGIQSCAQWTGRVVAIGGSTIVAEVGGLTTGAQFYIGGYLLRNTLS